MTYLGCPLVLICLTLPGFSGDALSAEESDPATAATVMDHGDSASKFNLSGNTLLYDTMGSDDSEIANDDVDTMLGLLRANTGIITLRLNSSGGSVWASKEMARIAIDFGLNTIVSGECSSSCVRIFLGGEARAMERGAKIGFHSRHWSPGAAETYYQRWRDEEGWRTPFDFVSWVYRDTYAEAYEDMSWSISRGVAAAFAVETHAPRDSIWFPTRAELAAAGVLRD